MVYCHLYYEQYGEVLKWTFVLPINTSREFKWKVVFIRWKLLKPVSSVETSYEWMNVHQILFDF